jgi:hypothetical protein
VALMHHEILRVNVLAPDDDEVFDVYADYGWLRGEHPDTDPDDPSPVIKRVLPPAKAKAKANPKD